MQELYYLLPIAAKDNKTPAANAEDEAEKLDEAAGDAAGVSHVGNEVEVTTENLVHKDEYEEEEEEEEDDDEEAQDDDDGDEWLAQRRKELFRYLFRPRLTRETF